MKLHALPITLAVAGLIFGARADFFDNFDSYANQAAFNAIWTANGGGSTLALESTNSFSAANAIAQSLTTAAQVNHLMAGIQGNVLDFSFRFYDAGGTRDFAQVYSRAGTVFTAGLNGALSFGSFNTTTSGKYAARFSAATPANGALFADGATIISATDTTGWFATSVSKSAGWHLMEVVGSVDPNNSAKDKFSFYVDGVLGGSVANAPDVTFNFAVLGGNNSSTPFGALYDDYSVSTVPEPGTLALSLLGGFAFALRAITRRRSC